MKIYTKTGDRGTTSLVGGQRVPKNHPRLEAYGTVDELMAQTALLRDNLPDTEAMKPYRDDLLRILDHLMRAASYLATEGDAPKYLPPLGDDQVGFLECRRRSGRSPRSRCRVAIRSSHSATSAGQSAAAASDGR